MRTAPGLPPCIRARYPAVATSTRELQVSGQHGVDCTHPFAIPAARSALTVALFPMRIFSLLNDAMQLVEALWIPPTQAPPDLESLECRTGLHSVLAPAACDYHLQSDHTRLQLDRTLVWHQPMLHRAAAGGQHLRGYAIYLWLQPRQEAICACRGQRLVHSTARQGNEDKAQ